MEGILLNAKNTNGGSATATLVTQALRAKKIFVFGELLALPQVQSLRNSPDTAATLHALEIFAYGTFADYVKQAKTLPDLNEQQAFKLKQLTVVSLASKSRSLPYADVMRETQLTSMRETEDLVIACVYDGLIRARLDQRNQQCIVQWSASRDVRPETIDAMISKLGNWTASADDVLARITRAMDEAGRARRTDADEHRLVREEAENVKQLVMRESSDSTLGQLAEPSAKSQRTTAQRMASSISGLLGRRS